jgi:4-carboxymuconolactone decarboxylase
MTGPETTPPARPADIDPASGCRLPLPKRESLSGGALKIFDELGTPNNKTIAGLKGPIGVQLHSPRLAELSHALNAYLRWESGLGGRVRELAILVTARECDSQFEWTAHEGQALREGVEPALVDIVRHRKSTDGIADADAIVIDFAREVLRNRKVAPETYARALRHFGARDLVDLVALIGNYAGTALLLAAFDVQLMPGQKPLLPQG